MPACRICCDAQSGDLGAGIQPQNWMIAGHPIALFAQYNRILVPSASFETLESQFSRRCAAVSRY
jgi:hypothetical protein